MVKFQERADLFNAEFDRIGEAVPELQCTTKFLMKCGQPMIMISYLEPVIPINIQWPCEKPEVLIQRVRDNLISWMNNALNDLEKLKGVG